MHCWTKRCAVFPNFRLFKTLKSLKMLQFALGTCYFLIAFYNIKIWLQSSRSTVVCYFNIIFSILKLTKLLNTHTMQLSRPNPRKPKTETGTSQKSYSSSGLYFLSKDIDKISCRTVLFVSPESTTLPTDPLPVPQQPQLLTVEVVAGSSHHLHYSQSPN